MRIIKFRFWDNVQKKMFDEVTLLGLHWKCEDDPSVYIGGTHFEYNDMGKTVPDYSDGAVMQFTGLHDGNGREIYEGDIIKITYHTHLSDKPFYLGQVIYGESENYPAFDLVPWIDCEMNALSWLKSESDESVVNYKVVGNIYQNPELLEGVNI